MTKKNGVPQKRSNLFTFISCLFQSFIPTTQDVVKKVCGFLQQSATRSRVLFMAREVDRRRRFYSKGEINSKIVAKLFGNCRKFGRTYCNTDSLTNRNSSQ